MTGGSGRCSEQRGTKVCLRCHKLACTLPAIAKPVSKKQLRHARNVFLFWAHIIEQPMRLTVRTYLFEEFLKFVVVFLGRRGALH
jgi:hypothetical protein